MSSFGQENQKQYYEAQMQKKVLYVPNLSMFLMKINEQILKLPHELRQEGQNEPIGTKYADIVLSVINGIDMVYSSLSPTRERFKELEVEGFSEYKEPDTAKELEPFPRALKKLEWVYLLLDKADMLNDHVITMELDPKAESLEDSEEEIDEEVLENGIDERSLPPPESKTNDEKMGGLEQKD